MPRMLFVIAAVLAAFVIGRTTAPIAEAEAKVVVKTEKTVETVRVACPEQAVAEAEPDEPDDPDAVDAEQTEVVRLLEDESRRVAAIQAAQGTLRGAVSDKRSRRMLVGVTIVASNGVDREQVVLSDEDGNFGLALAAGTYLVTMYYADAVVQYQQVNVYARQETHLHGFFELPDEPVGITISGGTSSEYE